MFGDIKVNMLTLNGKIINAFTQPESVDKISGEIREKKYKVQMLAKNEQQNGETRLDMVTLAVDCPDIYMKLQGQIVRIPVGVFADGRNIMYYALKGAKPEVAKQG